MDPATAPVGEFAGQSFALPLTVGLALAALIALAWRRPKLGGTTLVAPWCWSVVVLVSLVAVEVAIRVIGRPTPDWAGPLRFAAAMSTFGPAMALFGAKRPQNTGWQLIVLSLWGILSLPSIEWLLYGGQSEIHPARFWFLVVLVGAGTLNTLGTRYWPSSLLYCTGQLALLAPYFSVQQTLAGLPAPIVGLTAIVLGWVLLAADFPRGRTATAPLDRVWLDFRDAFGAVWALRIADRMNASARMYDWPVSLGWSGFRPRSTDAKEGEIPKVVEDAFRALLRRFVSPAWIDTRIGGIAHGQETNAPAA